MFGFFNIFFFTLLFFCAYVAFSQWRITKDRSIPWYIGYLAGTFLHYGRQFLLDISAAHIMPDPPLEWDTPLSYAAFACYFLFVREVMEVHRSAPVLSRVIVGMAFLLILSAGAIWYFWPSAPQEQPIETQRAPKPSQQSPLSRLRIRRPSHRRNLLKRRNRPTYNRKLVALADVWIDTHRQSLDLQCGTVMGGEDEEYPLFAAGLKAYKGNNSPEAIRLLRQIPAGSSYYASARELLALLYFEAKNFPAAARAYEAFAAEFSSPEADWRLALYYLAAYDSRKADFWKKMGEILDPDTPHPYKAQAEELKKTLEEKGIRGM